MKRKKQATSLKRLNLGISKQLRSLSLASVLCLTSFAGIFYAYLAMHVTTATVQKGLLNPPPAGNLNADLDHVKQFNESRSRTRSDYHSGHAGNFLTTFQGQGKEDIKSARLVSGREGVVWTTRHIMWTLDGGNTWSEITPPLVNDTLRIDFVAFQDNAKGWALLSRPLLQGNGVTLTLAFTTNRGVSWSMKQIPLSEVDAQMYSGQAAVSFVNSSLGWVMLRLASSSNASVGALYTTTDGGNTWDRLPSPPVGDPILFTSAKDGWVAGGPSGGELYVTHDSGSSWLPVNVTRPTDVDHSSEPVFDLPAFQSDLVGSLLVTYTAPSGSTLAHFRTSDGGASWQLVQTIPVAARLGLGVKAQYSVIDGTRSVLFEARNGRISSTYIGTDVVRQEGASAEGAVTHIARPSALDDSTAWVVASGQACRDNRGPCVLATGDGGLNWIDVTPPQLQKEKQPPRAAKEQQDDLLINLQPNLVSFQGKGFDTCAAPTISDLQAWWNDPTRPYKFVNMYYGGSDRGCKTWNQSMITASWMQQVSAMGWYLLPTWVGPQAPNTWPSGKYNLISTNTVTAQQQGISEASAAASAAASIGLGQGEILYVDIEGQYNQDAVTREAVRAYVNGWVVQLHNLGYKAGAYGSAYNVGDWASIANPPDAVWIVKVYSSNSCNSVFGLAPLSDDVWISHQRLRQCTQGHDETHNNVTLNIDTNLADGPLSTITTVTQNYTISVSASPSAGGTVSGGGTFAAGSSHTVTASANSGYTFTNWTENGNVVSLSASYTFTLSANRNLVANFGISSNDNCSFATIVSSTAYTATQDATFATWSSNDPATCFGGGAHSVWYRFTPASNRTVTIDTFGSSYDTVLAVYTGSCGSFTRAVCNDDSGGGLQSQVSFSATAGVTYYFGITSFGATAGSLTIHVNSAPPPCSFTISPTSRNFPTGGGGASVNVTASASNCVWSVTGVPSWVTITSGSSGTGSGTVFYSVASNSWVARSATLTIAGRPFTISQTGADNDDCSNATVVPSTLYINSQDASSATRASNDPATCNGDGYHSVWYRFTPALNRTVTIDTFGSSYDTVLAVYTGSCGSFTRAVCNDDSGGGWQSQVSFSATAGVTYYIVVTSYSASAGTLMLRVN